MGQGVERRARGGNGRLFLSLRGRRAPSEHNPSTFFSPLLVRLEALFFLFFFSEECAASVPMAVLLPDGEMIFNAAVGVKVRSDG